MLEHERDPLAEGSGTMLFQTLKSLLMLLPQSTCYNMLQDRLVSASRFRQSAISTNATEETRLSKQTETFVERVLEVRSIHCEALWQTIRAKSLEVGRRTEWPLHEEGSNRREWLGYESKEEERVAQARFREEKRRRGQSATTTNEIKPENDEFEAALPSETLNLEPNDPEEESWKGFWSETGDSTVAAS